MDACHRCGRRTAFRFWSWDDVTLEEALAAKLGRKPTKSEVEKIRNSDRKHAELVAQAGGTVSVNGVFPIKVPFCTWFCARAHHLATGHAVEDDAGKIVFSPTEERVFGVQPEAKP